MKKTVVVLACTLLALFFSSCSKNLEFKSQDEMMTQIEGVWKTENYAPEEYCVIREGKLFLSNENQLLSCWNDWMETALEKRGAEAWKGLTYDAALKQSISNRALEEITFTANPKKGTLSYVNDGETFTISVQEDGLRHEGEGKNSTRMFTKSKAEKPFSEEEFFSLFAKEKEEILENYNFPTKNYVKSTAQLRSFLVKLFPKLGNLQLVRSASNDGVDTYTDSGYTADYSASMVISKEMLTAAIDYFIGKEISVGYFLKGDEPQIIVSSQTNTIDIQVLIKIAYYAMENVPGILTPEKMLELYINGTDTGDAFSGGHTSGSVQAGNATYVISTPRLYYWEGKSHSASVLIQLGSKIPLKDLLSEEEKKAGLETPKAENNSEETKEETSIPTPTPEQNPEQNPSQNATQSVPSSSKSNGQSSNQKKCEHNFAPATCTSPEKCKKCGITQGKAKEHNFAFTSCTTPKKCSLCGEEMAGSVPGHSMKAATCTEPETCSTCGHTSGAALGHNLAFTKCMRSGCSHTDFSPLAKSYPNVTSYDAKTGAPLSVSNVSVNSSGVLSFTFKGQNYSISLKQKGNGFPYEFDCYLNGTLLSNANYQVGYYNMTHFTWNSMSNGDNLYFYTE